MLSREVEIVCELRSLPGSSKQLVCNRVMTLLSLFNLDQTGYGSDNILPS